MSAMSGTVTIAGKSIPKPALYVSGAVAIGIVGYGYWNKRNAVAVDTTDPNAIDPNLDPSTGLPWADEFGLGMGSFRPSGNTFDPTTGLATVTNTNAAWTQAAQAYLVTVGEYEANKVAQALGKAFSGAYMTPEEVAIWQAAIAFEGYPPQGYSGINTTPPGGQTTTPPPPATTTGAGPVTGLKVLKYDSKTRVVLDWSPVSGAKGYTVFRNGARIVSVVYSQAAINVSRNTSYTFGVQPIKSDGTLGTMATLKVKTPK